MTNVDVPIKSIGRYKFLLSVPPPYTPQHHLVGFRQHFLLISFCLTHTHTLLPPCSRYTSLFCFSTTFAQIGTGILRYFQISWIHFLSWQPSLRKNPSPPPNRFSSYLLHVHLTRSIRASAQGRNMGIAYLDLCRYSTSWADAKGMASLVRNNPDGSAYSAVLFCTYLRILFFFFVLGMVEPVQSDLFCPQDCF
jgi:hypothetical protein